MSLEKFLMDRMLGVLKKITLQTEDDFTQEFLELLFDELKLSSEEDWAIVVEVVLLKVVEEPQFCETYSKLCEAVVVYEQLRLRETFIGSPYSIDRNTSTFRNLLLRTCQHNFENVRIDKENAQTKEILEKRNHDRRIMFGNIRFIGELYKQNIIVPMIIHTYVMELFRRIIAGRAIFEPCSARFKSNKEAEEDTLECLCLLLSTVGEKLSKENIGNFAHQFPLYFEQLSKFDFSSPRIRFLIVDLLYLNKNGWKSSRRQEASKNEGDWLRVREIMMLVRNKKLKKDKRLDMRTQD